MSETSDSNKEVAEGTTTLYKSLENTLVNVLIKKPMKWIMSNPDIVIPIIESSISEKGKGYSDHSKKNFYRYISLYTRENSNNTKAYKKNYDKYVRYLESYSSKIALEYEKHELTDKQKNGLVSQEELIKKRDELGNKNEGSPIHLLLSVYTYIPPLRADFDRVKLYKYPDRPNKEDDKTTNFIIQNANKKMYLYLNEYKTSPTYSNQVILLPGELSKIIHNSFVKFPREYLFETKQKLQYSDAKQFDKWANRVFNRVFKKDGGLTIGLLRKIRSSSVAGETMEVKAELASKMLHKPITQNIYLKTDLISEKESKDGETDELKVVKKKIKKKNVENI
jgi:hypothetical protein